MTQILVIEDDPTQRMLTAAVLRTAGYDVVEAEDGLAGLQMASDAPPDLIVCDVMMPGMNGYKLIDTLKKEPKLAMIPVILLTAMADRSHVRVGMVSGADDYLFKPFRATELRQAVTALLAKRALQHSAFLRVSEFDKHTALQRQKSALTERYEKRLLQELNDRWTGEADHNTDISFDNACVLLVNIFSMVLGYVPADSGRGAAMRRVYLATSDSLYLFGAKHLIPMGDDLLAIFPDQKQTGTMQPAALAVRSVLGLQRMIGTAFGSIANQTTDCFATLPVITMALHTGAVQLIRIKDALHGDGLTLANGSAVNGVQALARHAKACGWEVVISSDLLPHLGEAAVAGQTACLAASEGTTALEAVELLVASPL